MPSPDFGEWLWKAGHREHERIAVLIKPHSIDAATPRRGVHGFIDMVLVEGEPPVRYVVTVRTKQSEAQVRRHIVNGECALSGFLSAKAEIGKDGWRFRPLVGRIGLRALGL